MMLDIFFTMEQHLRSYIEPRIIAGFDPTYGPCFKRWFKWWAWSIGDALPAKSEHRIKPYLSIPRAILQNVVRNLLEARNAIRRRAAISTQDYGKTSLDSVEVEDGA